MSTHPVMIVEKSLVLRQSLRQLLEANGYSVVKSVGCTEELEPDDALPKRFTVILSCCGAFDTVRSVKWIKSQYPAAQVVVLGGPNDATQSGWDAILNGANACLDSCTTTEAFFKALDLSEHGLAAVSISALSRSFYRNDAVELDAPKEEALPKPTKPEVIYTTELHGVAEAPPSFSPRESAILKLLQEGAPNKTIARNLCLTEATVKVHLKSILRKLRAKNRTQAALWAASQIESFGAKKPDANDGNQVSFKAA